MRQRLQHHRRAGRAASLLGIFGVAGKPEQRAQAARLLNLLMDGLRPRPVAQP